MENIEDNNEIQKEKPKRGRGALGTRKSYHTTNPERGNSRGYVNRGVIRADVAEFLRKITLEQMPTTKAYAEIWPDRSQDYKWIYQFRSRVLTHPVCKEYVAMLYKQLATRQQSYSDTIDDMVAVLKTLKEEKNWKEYTALMKVYQDTLKANKNKSKSSADDSEDDIIL
jgi:hypothetical protein